MTDKPEKFYLVSESQLCRHTSICIDYGLNVTPEAAALARQSASDCRKIEVPEDLALAIANGRVATHFPITKA